MILNIFAKKLAFFTQNKAKFCKILIITLVFEKNANFFAENCRKWQKIVIITSTPGHPAWSPKCFFLPMRKIINGWPPSMLNIYAPHSIVSPTLSIWKVPFAEMKKNLNTQVFILPASFFAGNDVGHHFSKKVMNNFSVKSCRNLQVLASAAKSSPPIEKLFFSCCFC
jgi:hypothetical protein